MNELMRRSGGIVVICLSSLFGPLLAQSAQISTEAALRDLRFEEAARHLANLPEAERAFYQCHIPCYQYLATQAPAYLAQFERKIALAHEAVDRLPAEDTLKYILAAELHMKEALVAFMQGTRLATLLQVRSCYRQMRKAEATNPRGSSHLKLSGLFHVLFASVPRKFQWLSRGLGYRGNLEIGLRELERAAKSSRLLQHEAHLVAYFVDRNIRGRPDLAIQRLERLRAQNDNQLYSLMLALAHMVIQQNDIALSVLQNSADFQRDPTVFNIPYWNMAIGKAHFYREDYARARIYLNQYLRLHKGNFFHQDARFRIGMSHLLAQNDTSARRNFREMLQHTTAVTDEDEAAVERAKSYVENWPDAADRTLYRARLRFDGGYYASALDLLDTLNDEKLSAGQRTERHYRYGRVLHVQGWTIKADDHYLEAIDQENSDAKWMQAYSCFFLGEIEREAGRVAAARSWYERALTFEDYPYQSGLETRCKTALEGLK